MRTIYASFLIATVTLASTPTRAAALTIVETYTASQFDFNIILPGIPDGGGGLNFNFTATQPTIDSTPGSVSFEGQPVDFDGTEASFIASTYTGTINVPATSGPATVPSTATGTATGPAWTLPQDFTFILPNFDLGPGFSDNSFDLVHGTTDWGAEFPSWQSPVVPELNGFGVFFSGVQDIQNVVPDTGGGTAQFSMVQSGAHEIGAVPEPSAFALGLISLLSLGFLVRRGR